MKCKCGHGSKKIICSDCACVKDKQPCGDECHCRQIPGVTCNNPYNKAAVFCTPAANPGTAAVSAPQPQPQPQQPFQQQPQQLAAWPAGPGNSIVSPHAAGAAQLVVVTPGTDRVQEDLRHDFDALAMLMTTLRDSLQFDPQKAGVYGVVFQMFFGAAERVVGNGRHPVAGYSLLECSGGTPELQHTLGTLLHKAELRIFRLENPAMMQWRVNGDVQEAALRDFFTQLYERVKPA